MKVKPIVRLRTALTDSRYFGGQLLDASWGNWKIVLLAIAGEELDADELSVFEQLTGLSRQPLQRPNEFFGIIGRRGGKSRACAVYAAWLASCFDWRPILGHGERGQIAILASTRDQASGLFNFVAGALDAASALRKMTIGRTTDTISLRSGVDIVVRPMSFRSTRGTTLISAICDEIAWWRSDDSALPDTEILRALRPGLTTTKGQLIAISSPFGKRGELWKAFDKHYGKAESKTLVARAPSIVMNDSLDPAWIAEQIALDPIGNDSEYNAVFRNDVDGFLRQEFVEACIVRGRHELPPIPSRRYFAFTDASGGASDSFTLGISHLEEGIAILDCIREVKPPFSHQNVVTEFAGVCKRYGCFTVSGDDYSGGMVKEMFRLAGVTYYKSIRTKSEIFLDLLPIINSGKCELLDDTRLFQQLCGLERTVARAGRETVCKGAGFHDDVANSCAGSLCLAALTAPALKFCLPFVDERPRAQSVRDIPSIPADPAFENPVCPSRPEYQTGADADWIRCMSWRPPGGRWCGRDHGRASRPRRSRICASQSEPRDGSTRVRCSRPPACRRYRPRGRRIDKGAAR